MNVVAVLLLALPSLITTVTVRVILMVGASARLTTVDQCAHIRVIEGHALERYRSNVAGEGHTIAANVADHTADAIGQCNICATNRQVFRDVGDVADREDQHGSGCGEVGTMMVARFLTGKAKKGAKKQRRLQQ